MNLLGEMNFERKDWWTDEQRAIFHREEHVTVTDSAITIILIDNSFSINFSINFSPIESILLQRAHFTSFQQRSGSFFWSELSSVSAAIKQLHGRFWNPFNEQLYRISWITFECMLSKQVARVCVYVCVVFFFFYVQIRIIGLVF